MDNAEYSRLKRDLESAKKQITRQLVVIHSLVLGAQDLTSIISHEEFCKKCSVEAGLSMSLAILAAFGMIKENESLIRDALDNPEGMVSDILPKDQRS